MQMQMLYSLQESVLIVALAFVTFKVAWVVVIVSLHKDFQSSRSHLEGLMKKR